MKKRILSLLLALALVGSPVCALAAESEDPAPQASLYLDGYSVTIKPKGGGLMSVTFIVYGTDTMDCIGAQKIVVEEWDGSEWDNPITFTAEQNSNFYKANAAEYTASTSFYGIPGLQYRATLTAYAELDGGSDTGTFTCTPKTCR